MKAKKVDKGLSKLKKAAGYISTIATVGIILTRFFKRKKVKIFESFKNIINKLI